MTSCNHNVADLQVGMLRSWSLSFVWALALRSSCTSAAFLSSGLARLPPRLQLVWDSKWARARPRRHSSFVAHIEATKMCPTGGHAYPMCAATMKALSLSLSLSPSLCSSSLLPQLPPSLYPAIDFGRSLAALKVFKSSEVCSARILACHAQCQSGRLGGGSASAPSGALSGAGARLGHRPRG